MSDSHAAVRVRGLRKRFGANQVLDGVDLTVAPGTVHALLGANGAGKTTSIAIMTTLLDADEGDVRVLGHDPDREPDLVRANIGVTGQFSAVDELMTGRQNLRLMADLHHLPRAAGQARVEELLEQFGLVEAADRASSTYSGGMRRRLDIAMTLVGRPSLIFLDEPTTGLDPAARQDTWELIRGLVADGATVLLTSQYLDEVDRLAQHVDVLDGGRIVASGTPSELKELVPGGHIAFTFEDLPDLRRAQSVLPEATIADAPCALQVDTAAGRAVTMRDALTRLQAAGIEISDVTVHSPGLDDVFRALTRKETAA